MINQSSSVILPLPGGRALGAINGFSAGTSVFKKVQLIPVIYLKFAQKWKHTACTMLFLD